MPERKPGGEIFKYGGEEGIKTRERREQKDLRPLIREWPQEWRDRLETSLREALSHGLKTDEVYKIGTIDAEDWLRSEMENEPNEVRRQCLRGRFGHITFEGTVVNEDNTKTLMEGSHTTIHLFDLLRNASESDNKKIVEIVKEMQDYFDSAEYAGVKKDADAKAKYPRDDGGEDFESREYDIHVTERVNQRFHYFADQVWLDGDTVQPEAIIYARSKDGEIERMRREAYAERDGKKQQPMFAQFNEADANLLKDLEYVRGRILKDALYGLATRFRSASFAHNSMGGGIIDPRTRKLRENQIAQNPIQFEPLLKQLDSFSKKTKKPKQAEKPQSTRW